MKSNTWTLSIAIMVAATAGSAAVGAEPVRNTEVHPVEVDLGTLAAVQPGLRGATVDAPKAALGGTNLSQLVSFDSIDSNECCGGNTVVPSDPDIAAGANHLLVAVNLAFEIYDTAGTSLVGPLELTTFFGPLGGGCTSSSFYPVTLYDEAAGRFILGADGDGTHFCVAVSQTADPTGNWWLYGFPVDVGGAFFDWPQVGIGRDAIYLGATMFGTGTGRVWALDKTAMYAGAGAGYVTQDLGDYRRPQPLHLHGASDASWPQSGPHHFLSLADPPDPGVFTLHRWSDPFGANSFVTVGDLNIEAAHGISIDNPIPFPQAGGSPIDGATELFKDFEYRNGSGWTTNHVSCIVGHDPVDCIQWAEIRLDTETIGQAGVFGSENFFRTYPNLAVNACGDMAVGYTRSSAGVFPGIGAAGRQVTDPPGFLQLEIMAKGGETPYDAFTYRWGEYTGMTTDPYGEKFWYAGVYSKNNGNASANWGTYVSSFAFPQCAHHIFRDAFESGDATAWSATQP